jgi:hypothetical protein
MGIDIDKLFDGMATKEIGGSGNFMGEGLYVVETKQLFVKEGFKGKSFICEFEIVKSDNDAHPVGSTGSYVLKFENPYAFGNISELVIALLGYENTKENQTNKTIRDQVQDVTSAACGSDKAKAKLGANSEDGMLLGIRLKLECRKKATAPKAGRPEGGEFTVHKWSPTTETLAAQAA